MTLERETGPQLLENEKGKRGRAARHTQEAPPQAEGTRGGGWVLGPRSFKGSLAERGPALGGDEPPKAGTSVGHREADVKKEKSPASVVEH